MRYVRRRLLTPSLKENRVLARSLKLTGARWLALVALADLGWEVVESTGLKEEPLALLGQWLDLVSSRGWLEKVSGQATVYQRKLPKKYTSISKSILAASVEGQASVLLAGVSTNPKAAKKDTLILAAAAATNDLNAQISALADLGIERLSGAAMLQRASTWLKRTIDADRVTFFQIVESEQILRAIQGPAETVSLEGTLEGSVYRIGETVRIDHIARQSRYSGLVESTQSKVVAPLRSGGKLLGVVSVESDAPNQFEIQAERVITMLAAQVGAIWAAFQAQDAQAQLRGALAAVRQVQSAGLSVDELPELAQSIADFLADTFGFDLALFLVLDPVSTEFVAEGVGGRAKHGLPGGLRVSCDFGFPGTVLDRGEAVEAHAPQDHKSYQAFPDWESGYAIAVPILIDEAVVAVFNGEMNKGRGSPIVDLATFSALVNMLPTLFNNTIMAVRVGELQQAQRLAEERLLRSEKLAAVGELAAGVAHELDNPLTTVAGFAELVMESLPQGSAERADLALVVSEAQRAREVVRRLLDFSRQGEFLHAEADIHEVIAAVLALLNHQAQLAQVEIRAALWDDLPRLTVDKNQMQQVLINLIQNAIQAMPDGGSIDIQTQVQSQNDLERVTVSLQDSGIGIPSENLERIFEPFFTTRQGEDGTGLGLAISYSIVSEHGGFIDVNSQPGEGARFTIWLPVKQALADVLKPEPLEGARG
jgi:signal transduction histidine kinase/putative methionine-R-sulfoxide reductase with GAF domain